MQVHRLGNERIEIRSLWTDSSAFWLSGGRAPIAVAAAALGMLPAVSMETCLIQLLWMLVAPPLIFVAAWRALGIPRAVVDIDILSRLLHIAHRDLWSARVETHAWRDVAGVTVQCGEDDSEAWVWLHLHSGAKVSLLPGLLQRRHAGRGPHRARVSLAKPASASSRERMIAEPWWSRRPIRHARLRIVSVDSARPAAKREKR